MHSEMSPMSPHSLALNKIPTLETENHTLPCSAPGPLAPSSPNFIVLHTSLGSLLLLEHGKLFSATGPLNVPVSLLRIPIAEVTHSGTLSAISRQFTPLSIFFLFAPCRLYHFFFFKFHREHIFGNYLSLLTHSIHIFWACTLCPAVWLIVLRLA